MRHPFRNVLLGLLAMSVALVVAVNVLSVSRAELPPPDESMLITMPDGDRRPLFELLEAAHRDEPAEAPAEPLAVASQGVEQEPDSVEAQAVDLAEMEADEREALVQDFLEARLARADEPPEAGDLYGLAEYSLDHGDVEQALALFQSVPPDDRRYARAQRRIGWDIYTKAKDAPSMGVSFVNDSLSADPFDGNAWQDAVRVYGRSLGLPVD